MGQTGQTGKKGQTDQPFRLYFPGNLCRAAFTILAMYLAWFLDALASLDFKLPLKLFYMFFSSDFHIMNDNH